MKKKLVDVIIPYYKKKKFIVKTISSILNQSFKNFKIILIYDDDDLEEYLYIKKIFKNKIHIIKNKKNLGVGASRNKGIYNSKSKYIAFCDADDIWVKDKLAKQIKYMDNLKLDFTHTSYFIINEKNKKIGKMNIKKKLTYSDLLKSCDIGLSTVIIKTKILKKNLFKSLKTKEDFALWLQLLRKNIKITGLQEYLSSWRKSSNSLSSSSYQKISDAFILYNKYEKFDKILSFFLTLRLSIYFIVKFLKQKIK
jgi:teichuronic acid biosynthesis glycosyltransferase TuaG